MLIFTKLSKRNDELAAPSNGIFIYVMPLGTMDRSSLRDSSAKESDAPSSSHQLTVTHLALGRSALTVENVKKLQQEYEAAGRFTTKESVQDFLCKQAQILTPPEILCHNIGAGYAALGAKVSDGISSSVGATEDDESVASLETILVNNAETDKKALGSEPQSCHQILHSAHESEGEINTIAVSLSTLALGMLKDVVSDDIQLNPVDVHTQTEWDRSRKSIIHIDNDYDLSRKMAAHGLVLPAQQSQGNLPDSPHRQKSIRFLQDEHPEKKQGDTQNEEICVLCDPVPKISLSLDHYIAEALETHPEEYEEAIKDGHICEFCYQCTKPFPTIEQLSTQPMESLFCCHMYKAVLQDLIQEITAPPTPSKKVELIDIQPHAHRSMQLRMKQSVEKWVGLHVDKTALGTVKKLLEKPLSTERVSTAVNWRSQEENKQLAQLAKKLNIDESLHVSTTDSFLVTEDRDGFIEIPTGQTGQSSSTLDANEVNAVDRFTSTQELEAGYVKKCEERVNRFYRSGQILHLVFPDGTGQVCYPSGNVAILIARTEPIQFTFIIMEDEYIKPRIRAIFKSNGQSTCYRPNGSLWLNLDPSGGYYFNKNGTRLTRWMWKDRVNHVHAPPVQPITLKLNPRIEIRILTQDQIQLTFSTRRSGLKFNLGAKLKPKDPQEALEVRMSDEQLLLRQKSLLIQNLLARIKIELRRSKSYTFQRNPSGNLPNQASPASPQASKLKASISVGQSKSAAEQHRGKQPPQGTLGKSTKTHESVIKLRGKDQPDPQQGKAKGKEQLGAVRRGSAASSARIPAVKSQSSNVTKLNL